VSRHSPFSTSRPRPGGDPAISASTLPTQPLDRSLFNFPLFGPNMDFSALQELARFSAPLFGVRSTTGV
jgi:hypothetical protein